MEKEHQSVDELFRLVLKDQEMPPPADAWNNIEKTLDSKKKVRVIWIIRALAAVVTLMVTFASGYFIAKHNSNSLISANKQSIQIQTIPNQSQSAANQILQTNATTKQEPAAIKNESNKETTQTASNSFVIAATDNSELQPAINTTAVTEDSRLAYIQPVQAILQARGNITPGISALEAQTNRISEITSEEIVLDDKKSSNETNASSARWSLGGQVSPLYAFREISASGKANASLNQLAANSGQKESGIISYSGGMNVEYKASKRLSVSSGLYYSRMGQNIGGNEAAYGASITANVSLSANQGAYYSFQNSTGTLKANNNTGQNGLQSNDKIYGYPLTNVFLTGDQPATLLQTMDFLELPVMVRYRIIDRKVGFHVLGGLSTHILVANKLILEDPAGRQDYGNTSGLSTFSYSSTFGVGLDYTLSKKIHLNLEPAFKYYINSINSSGNIESHPYSFGIYTGMCYTF